MESKPLMLERLLDAPVEIVWEALTNNNEMKKWYFDLPDFKAEIGFEFQFVGGPPEKQYLHLCKITQVVPGSKVAYSWVYDGYEGYSEVSFELFAEGDKTRLVLTHRGLESFPASNQDLARHNFEAGWASILDNALKGYLDNVVL